MGLRYNVTTLYNIHPGLWIIFRALWIVPGACKTKNKKKSSATAESVLSCYDVSVTDFPHLRAVSFISG